MVLTLPRGSSPRASSSSRDALGDVLPERAAVFTPAGSLFLWKDPVLPGVPYPRGTIRLRPRRVGNSQRRSRGPLSPEFSTGGHRLLRHFERWRYCRSLQPNLYGTRAVSPASRRGGASDRGARHDVSENPASRSGPDHRHADHRFYDDNREVYLSTSPRPTATGDSSQRGDAVFPRYSGQPAPRCAGRASNRDPG